MADAQYPKYVAEFVGTFLLVFTVGCNVIAGNAAWAVTSIAAVLMVSIYALGGVSGANFNPAVSIAIGMSNSEVNKGTNMDWKEVAIYCAVQIAAGISAGLCYSAMLWQTVHVAPKPGFSWWQAGVAETLYTFMLCFVVLNCAISKKNGCGSMEGKQEFYGLAIGFCVVAGGYGAGAISGGCFNPAVAIGLDLSSAGVGFGWSLLYTAFEVAGAALAAGLFRVVRPDQFGSSPPHELLPKCVSEFLGTFILVLTVGLNVLSASPAAAYSIAASLMCMIYALGDVSGGHFNPAVTVAVIASGRDKQDPKIGGIYIGCQLAGGILAAFTYAALHHGHTFDLGPVPPYTWAPAMVGEVIFTFVLCFVVLSVATTKNALENQYAWAIGSCVTVGGLAIGNISGGSLNPAVSVGISSARILGGGLFYNCMIYSAAELVGGVAAAGVFRATHVAEYEKSGYLLPKSG